MNTMKRISWFLIALFVFAGSVMKAQVPAGATTALNYSGLESKLKKSESDIQDPKKNIKVKTWTNRADLMVNIYNINNDVLRKGMDPVSVKLFYKEPLEIQTSQEGPDKIENYVYDRATLKFKNGVLDSWVDTKPIHPNPLGEAIKALDEANKLNTDGKADKDILSTIKGLKAALETEAVSKYDKKEFQASHDNFIKMLDLNKLPVMKNQVDTIYLYYAGRAALEAKDYKEANRLFEEAVANKFEDPYLYVFRKQSYFASGDTAKGVAVITAGFNKYPDNQSILIEMINYYLTTNQADAALKLLAVAKASDPQNVSYTFAESTLYDKMGKFDDAERSYKTCLEISPNYFDAAYNLGVLYFNKAVKIYEDASKITDNAEYEKAKASGDEMLLKAVPYMEKAHEIDAKDKPSLETLKTIFYRLKMDDKYKTVVEELKNL
jgi:tetratricopeptide (TPR) repeat protein